MTQTLRTLNALLAETFDNFEVNGAAHDASPNLIFGGSFSSSRSAIAFVMPAMSNWKKGEVTKVDRETATGEYLL